jgi:ribosome-binding factor A
MGKAKTASSEQHGTRVLRVERAVREELAALLAAEVRDPGAAGAIVTRVEMSKDLRSARVHVRLLEGGDDAAKRKALVDGLHRASGMLRSELTRRLQLRFAPEVRFMYDEGVDRSTRIESLLAEIEAEKKAK